MESMAKVQLMFKQELLEKIKAIKEEYGLTTIKSFFDNAIALLLWAIEEAKEGRTIASVDKKNMEMREVVLPFLTTKRGQEKKGKNLHIAAAARS